MYIFLIVLPRAWDNAVSSGKNNNKQFYCCWAFYQSLQQALTFKDIIIGFWLFFKLSPASYLDLEPWAQTISEETVHRKQGQIKVEMLSLPAEFVGKDTMRMSWDRPCHWDKALLAQLINTQASTVFGLGQVI